MGSRLPALRFPTRTRYRIALGILGLLVVVLLYAVYWISFGGLDDYFRSRLISDLKDMNVRLEVDKAKLGLRAGRVELEDLKLYLEGETDPFATVKKLEATFDITSYWQQRIDLKTFVITEPTVVITFDSEGRANFEKIKLPERRGDTDQKLTYLMAEVEIKNGELRYGDLRRTIDGTVDNFGLTFLPKTSDDNQIFHRLDASFSDSNLRVGDSAIKDIKGEVHADITREGAKVEKLEITSSAGTITLSGKVEDWRELKYDFNAKVDLALDQVAAVADPASGITGKAKVDGRLWGQGENYNFEGDLTADDLLAAGFRADDLRVDGRISGERRDVDFNGSLAAGRLAALDYNISNLSFDGRVNSKGGDTRASGTARVGGIAGQGFSVSNVTFTGDVAASGTSADASGTARVGGISGQGFAASNIAFTGDVAATDGVAQAKGTATVGRFKAGDAVGENLLFRGTASGLGGGSVDGDVTLSSLTTRATKVGNVRAKVTGSAGRFEIPTFSASVYDGSVSGKATIALGGGQSALSAEFRGVDLDRAAGAATGNAPRVRGRASGTVALRWPGANVQAASGTVRAKIDGEIPSEQGAIPLQGDVALVATPGRFRIERADLVSDGTRVSATGTVGWDRRANIDLRAEAEDASRLIQILEAVNPKVAEQVAESGIRLGGAFLFEGRVTGPVTNPNVQGRVDIASVTVQGSELGAFSADINKVGGELGLANAVLRGPDGSEIAFDFQLPGGGGPQVIRATVTRFPTRVLLASSGIRLTPALAGIGGTVTGTIDVTLPGGERKKGLEAIKGARGLLDITIENANFGGEPLTEFAIRADFNETGATLSKLRIASARGALDGKGTFDYASEAYRFTMTGRDVDLKIVEAFAAVASDEEGLDNPPPPFTLAGRADMDLIVAGRGASMAKFVDGLTELTFDLTGREVIFNGNQVGAAKLNVLTENGVATVRATADALRGLPELVGTVNLVEKGRPINFALDLNGVDVARLGPNPPAGVTTRATGRVEVTGSLDRLMDSKPGQPPPLVATGRFSELALSVAVDAAGRNYDLVNKGDVVFSATPAAVRIESATFTGEGTALTVAGDLAIASGGSSNLSLNGDINLALLSSLTRDAYAGGIATLQASVMGSLANPRFSGFADVRDMSLRVVDLPIAFQNGAGRILFTSNQALIESFTGTSGGGRVRVTGGLVFAGLRPSRFRFEVDADQIRANYPQDVQSVIDGKLTIQGNEAVQVLGGSVVVRRAEYTEDVDLNDLISLDSNGPLSGGGQGIGQGPAGSLRLDLRVEARESLIIRNNVADIVASASLVLTGPADDPIIDGRATVSRGTLQFRNGDYQVTRGIVRFPGRAGGDITFDLQAETEIQGYRVGVGFSGTPSKPYPTFRSEPALPQSQILSLLLTGDLGAEQPGGADIARSGVGMAASLLTESISRSVEKGTDRLFGINRFQIDPLVVPGSDPTARVTLGRRISKNLSLTYSTNLSSTSEQVIALEYKISDRISVVAVRERDGSYGLDVRFRKRF